MTPVWVKMKGLTAGLRVKIVKASQNFYRMVVTWRLSADAKSFCWCCFFLDGWNRTSHGCTRNEYGVWELTLPYKEDGSSPIPHGSKVKVSKLITVSKETSCYCIHRRRTHTIWVVFFWCDLKWLVGIKCNAVIEGKNAAFLQVHKHSYSATGNEPR